MIYQSESDQKQAREDSLLFSSNAQEGKCDDLVDRGSREIVSLYFPLSDEMKYETPEGVGSDGEDDVGLAASGFDDSALLVARLQGYEEARLQFTQELGSAAEKDRVRVKALRKAFVRDRSRFYEAAEYQVVQLALAISSKVLGREVTGTNLPLQDVVRAVLARVQDETAVLLRVPAEEQDAWRALFGETESVDNARTRIQIAGESSMVPGECVIETDVGRVDVGVDVQLREIERGFAVFMQGQEAD